MPGIFDKLFPRKTLEGVHEPAQVSVMARVASLNGLTSQISGLAAALFGWRFFVRYTVNQHNYHGEHERTELLWSCISGDSILLSTPQGTVLVPAQGLVLRSAVEAAYGIPVDHPLPPEAAHVLDMPAAKLGVVLYDELALRTGYAVRLVGTVAAWATSGRSAYRSSGNITADYVARPELGELSLVDESLSQETA